MAAELDVRLAEAERLAGRDPDLGRDEVDPGQHLGDRVLDLDPAVDLDEVEVAVGVDEELERADVLVARRDHGPDRPLAEVRAGRRRTAPASGASSRIFWWRRWTEQSRSPRWTPCAVAVDGDLDLDVAVLLEPLLEVERVVAERRARLGAADLSDASSSRGERTMRMPLPPPPAEGLMSTG